jgi:hypothetical protein
MDVDGCEKDRAITVNLDDEASVRDMVVQLVEASRMGRRVEVTPEWTNLFIKCENVGLTINDDQEKRENQIEQFEKWIIGCGFFFRMLTFVTSVTYMPKVGSPLQQQLDIEFKKRTEGCNFACPKVGNFCNYDYNYKWYPPIGKISCDKFGQTVIAPFDSEKSRLYREWYIPVDIDIVGQSNFTGGKYHENIVDTYEGKRSLALSVKLYERFWSTECKFEKTQYFDICCNGNVTSREIVVYQENAEPIVVHKFTDGRDLKTTSINEEAMKPKILKSLQEALLSYIEDQNSAISIFLDFVFEEILDYYGRTKWRRDVEVLKNAKITQPNDGKIDCIYDAENTRGERGLRFQVVNGMIQVFSLRNVSGEEKVAAVTAFVVEIGTYPEAIRTRLSDFQTEKEQVGVFKEIRNKLATRCKQETVGADGCKYAKWVENYITLLRMGASAKRADMVTQKAEWAAPYEIYRLAYWAKHCKKCDPRKYEAEIPSTVERPPVFEPEGRKKWTDVVT